MKLSIFDHFGPTKMKNFHDYNINYTYTCVINILNN